MSLHTPSSGTRLSTGISHTCHPRAAWLPPVTCGADCRVQETLGVSLGVWVLVVRGQEAPGISKRDKCDTHGPEGKSGVQRPPPPPRSLPVPACLPAETSTTHPVCGAPVALQREKGQEGHHAPQPAYTAWRRRGGHWATEEPRTQCHDVTRPRSNVMRKAATSVVLPLKAQDLVSRGTNPDGAP